MFSMGGPEQEMAESRRSTRQRTMLGAKIVFNNRMSTLECRIRNISSEGAKILLGDHYAVPQVFEFYVPQKDETYRARVIWRHDNEAGIEFLEDPRAVRAAGDSNSRVQDLERENSLLKKRIQELQSRLDRHMEAGI